MFKATANRLPHDKTLSGWHDILPKRQPQPELNQDIETDYLIIGAGITGLAAAYRLNELGEQNITLIDAQSVGWGASGRNSGFMIDLPHDLQSDHYASSVAADQHKIMLNREAIEFAAQMVDQFNLHQAFDRCGKYHGAANAKGLAGLRQFQRHLDDLGEAYQPMDQADFKAVTGSDYYLGGLFTPACVMVQPAQYIQGLADGLVDSAAGRVRLYENTPAIEISAGETHVVTTPDGVIRCKKIILANNGHLESFGLFKGRLMHIHLFASMTRALSSAEQSSLSGQANWGVIPALPMGSTIRRHGNRIVVRNHISYTPSQSESARSNSRSSRRHLRAFNARFPMLDGVDMQYHWAGALCLSLNSVPAFGEVAKGVFAAGCQNGLGLTAGTLNGKLIAEQICGVDSEALQAVQKLAPPRKLYPEPVMSLGAKTHLWWGQRKAGLDL